MKAFIFILISMGVVIKAFTQSKEEVFVEQALLNYLPCTFFKTNFEECFLPFNKDAYSQKSRQILLTILNRAMNQDQLFLFAEGMYVKHIENKIKTIEGVLLDTAEYPLTKKRSQFYIATRDSLRKNLVSRDSDDFVQFVERVKNAKVTKEVIYIAGVLEDSRFIPSLKTALTDNVHFDSAAVCLALARLKVEPYYSICLKKYAVTSSDSYRGEKLNFKSYQDIIAHHRQIEGKLIYIATPSSIESYCSFLEFEFYAPSSDDEYFPSVHAYVVHNLQRLILNKEFQRYFSTKDVFSKELTLKDINWLKKWLAQNRAKLDFDFTYLPNSFF